MTSEPSEHLEPLDPLHLTPRVSLNRVRIVDLPGVALDASIRGKTAFELLAANTLIEEVRLNADRLALQTFCTAPGTELLPAFACCFTAEAPTVRETANAIARKFGYALGALILTLKRGDPINRQARPEWDETYWAQWSDIRAIWLGGGLMTGPLGKCIRHHARAQLAADKAHTCDLHVAAYPSLLPLTGAARSASPTHAAALVFDFGHSTVKRAVAYYQNGELIALRPLPLLPAPGVSTAHSGDLTRDQVEDIATQMVGLMLKTRGDVSLLEESLAPLLISSIASYEANGQPLPRQGGMYASLHQLAGNAARWMASRATQQANTPLDVMLIHDGTAAARMYAGADHAAVMMLGTALGVGFVPREPMSCPFALGFTMRD